MYSYILFIVLGCTSCCGRRAVCVPVIAAQRRRKCINIVVHIICRPRFHCCVAVDVYSVTLLVLYWLAVECCAFRATSSYLILKKN